MAASPAHYDQSHDIHGRPGWALVYLAFVYLPLLFWPDAPASALYASLLATAMFLPLHWYRFRGGQRWRQLSVFLLAAIGYALIPFNSGGNTFVIYAFAQAAMVFAPRVAVAWCALLFAAMALELLWLLPRIEIALGISGVVALIGFMVVAGILYARARWRRDAALRLSQDEVRRLAAVAERERIARDLHDLLGHTLSVVVLKSELAGKLIDRDPAAARQQIDEVQQVARQALGQVREAVSGFRAAGLEAELASARLALLSADIRLDQQLPPLALDERSDQTLALALREAVTNILRHAEAHRVEVDLQRDEQGLHLHIADDGRGGVTMWGNGLQGMRERLAGLGGRLEIDSPLGAGTRLSLHLPALAEVSA